MFAVLKTGGKQYKVATGDVLRVEKLAAEAGDRIQFNEVLVIGGDSMTVGTPTIDGAAVQAEVIDQIKGEKLIHFVKRRRKHGSKRTKGHRQQLTLLRVGDILASGGADTGVKEAIGAGSAPSPKVAGLPAGDEAFAGVPETASDEDKIVEAVTQGTRPANLLAAARGGKPDELTRIGGVGPKLEKLLHETGVFHFDQIAAWGPEEVAYMDDTMSLKGRVARDGWIDQAKQFAADQE